MEAARINPIKAGKNWSLPKKKLLRRVLQSDPTQEYFVYVPGTGAQEAPLCVLVHGIRRNPRNLVRRFSELAETLGVVLVAPHFTHEQHNGYQKLGRDGRGTRADLALNAIIEEMAWLTGAATLQVYLFGHSGGAQFAHRYAMAYPHRVARAVLVGAGWYTVPDVRQRFPYGVRPNRRLRGVRFDPEEFLRVPMTVIIGSEDTTTNGVRRSKRVEPQGSNRLERARNWVACMKAAAETYRLESVVTLEEIEGGKHSLRDLMTDSQLGGRVFEALFGLPLTKAATGGNGKESVGDQQAAS
jgi:pimeloyl-ACP methyl ester carboxylesterase